MILYYCEHNIALSYIVSLQCHRHISEESILLARNPFPKSSFAEQLVKIGLFKKIISVECPFMFKLKTIEEQEVAICKYFDELFAKNELALESFEQIYIGCDVNNELGIYLSVKGKEHIMLELTIEQFNESYRYDVNEKFFNANPSFTDVLKKYDILCGSENKYITKRLRYKSEKSKLNGVLPKDEWVNFQEMFCNLPKGSKEKLVKCLDPSIHSLQEKQSCLILPNSPRYVNPKTGLKQGSNMNLPYQIMADYYAGEWNLFVKEHPHIDHLHPVNKYLQDVVTLDASIPIEFYTLLDSLSIRRTLSCSTTAMRYLTEYIEENIRLGDSFYHNFRLCHKLFFIFSLAKLITNYETVYHAAGMDMDFLRKFARLCFCDFGAYDPKGVAWNILKLDIFVIIGKIPPGERGNVIKALSESDPKTKVIFLELNEQLELIKNIIPVTITKTPTDDSCIDSLEPETFYFFCKDKSIREKVQSFSMQKELRHTRLLLTAKVSGAF